MKKALKKIYIFTLITTFLLAIFHHNLPKEIPINININEEKIAYLSFDDGPSKNTEKILEILDIYNIKATFFVTGPSYYLKYSLLKKIVSSGHEVAIHSYEHNYSYIYKSKENYILDFKKCAKWIKETTGVEPNLYRFPGGSSNTIADKKLIKEIIKELEKELYSHVDWNVDTNDSYVKNESNKIITNALTAIKRNESNSIYYQTILMHDDTNKPNTVEALTLLIEKLIHRGYQFKKLTKSEHIVKHVK